MFFSSDLMVLYVINYIVFFRLDGPIIPLIGNTMPVVLITGLPRKFVEHLTMVRVFH